MKQEIHLRRVDVQFIAKTVRYGGGEEKNAATSVVSER